MTGNMRLAKESDAKAISEIYRPYVENTAVTFEYEPPDAQEIERRIKNTSALFPYLLWEDESGILGYAYAGKIGERAAYSWSAELSIYLKETGRGKGAAKKLYDCLCEILRLQGVRTAYGKISLPNDRSVAFHKKCGFVQVAVMKNIGFKLGKWRDLLWMEKKLGDYSESPPPVIAFPALENSIVMSIIEKYSGSD